MALDATTLTLVLLGLALAVAGVVAPPLRTQRRGVVLAGALVTAAGAVFALVATDEALAVADAPVLGRMIALRSPGWTSAAETVSSVGGTTFTGGAAVVAALVLALRGYRRRAVVWVAGVAVGAATIRLVKLAAERPRPPLAARLAEESTASLPSGHSLMAALGLGLTVGAVVVLTRGTRSAGPLRTVAATLGLLTVLVIGASRAYLGVHWTTDVLAGWLLGASLAVACTVVARLLEARVHGDGGAAAARRERGPSRPAGFTARRSD